MKKVSGFNIQHIPLFHDLTLNYDSYFLFDNYNKMKFKYSHNDQVEIGKLITHIPIYCIKMTENRLILRHTFNRTYLASILYDQCLHTVLHNDDEIM